MRAVRADRPKSAFYKGGKSGHIRPFSAKQVGENMETSHSTRLVSAMPSA
jgi:hypothetical protein